VRVLICGAQTPVECTAPAVRHVQLHAQNGDRFVELVLCDAHFEELEAGYRRDWHAVDRMCNYPWRSWSHVHRRCVLDDDGSVRYFTLEELAQVGEDDLGEDPATQP
jgi:hypothetical protein